MTGLITIKHDPADPIARVTIANVGKANAIDISMWRELQTVFEHLQALPEPQAPHAVIVSGEGGQFASGGDILEFVKFRFDEEALYNFHEHIVAPALQAMLNCDIVLLAQIDGACIGGGLEIAACCDIRICGEASRFGVPIARLGFPMAPSEMQMLSRVIAAPTMREMLLEARVFDAASALRVGLVHSVVPDPQVGASTLQRAQALSHLSNQAARLNKRCLRQIADGGLTPAQLREHFSYADSPQHREGINAFIEKRVPRFQRG